jgi:hypothetical protein
MLSNAPESSDMQQTEEVSERTVPTLSRAERALLQASAIANSRAGFECPNCGASAKYGELACAKCNVLFSAGGKTHKLDQESTHPRSDQKWPIGEVFVQPQQVITFDIGGEKLVLPDRDTLVIGRVSEVPGDDGPDVNLSAFDAKDYGVSRQHIRITRINDMVYVTDLGSSNGTFLNGRALAPNYGRLLRNGDELWLGRLKMRVSFSQ